MKGLIRDERGMAFTVALLIFLPVFVAGLILILEQPRLVHGGEDLQHAVSEATRAAAMRVNETSQAYGEPGINPAEAHETFKEVLAYNLALHKDTLQPKTGSGMDAAPSYTFVVYNGNNPHVPTGKKYSFSGSLSETDLTSESFPQEFSITENNITPGTGSRTVELDGPGCAAVIKQKVKPVAAQSATTTIRWATAEIETLN